MKILKVLLQHQLVKLSREMKTQKYNKSKEQEEPERQQVTRNDHQSSSLPSSSSSINLWLPSLCPHGFIILNSLEILLQRSLLAMAWVLSVVFLSLSRRSGGFTCATVAGDCYTCSWLLMNGPFQPCISSFHLLAGWRCSVDLFLDFYLRIFFSISHVPLWLFAPHDELSLFYYGLISYSTVIVRLLSAALWTAVITFLV